MNFWLDDPIMKTVMPLALSPAVKALYSKFAASDEYYGFSFHNAKVLYSS